VSDRASKCAIVRGEVTESSASYELSKVTQSDKSTTASCTDVRASHSVASISDMARLSLFTFGYWEWGSDTQLLLDVTAALPKLVWGFDDLLGEWRKLEREGGLEWRVSSAASSRS